MPQSSSASESLSYRDSGVDIDAGEELVRRIGPAVKRTHRDGVLGGIGGFGALFELPLEKYRNPVLVSGTDGVGTKLKLATMLDRHDTIGIDLVAMCVNDIVVTGAEPLYFLDYFATSRLNVDQAESVITGIAEGCRLAGCALAGGETAEMPGMYGEGDYDLAGFAVGIVEKDRMISTGGARAGQVLLGIASSGPHSNGFSLIRKVLERSQDTVTSPMAGTTLGAALLEPTRIYVRPLLSLLESTPVSALAHITGGGITENLPRVLPDDTIAVIDRSSWEMPAVFHWLQREGAITDEEMLRTFNCGIGMIAVVEESDVNAAVHCLQEAGETAFVIGRVDSGSGAAHVRYIHS